MKPTIIFTDHADFDNPKMLAALCYGTSNKKSKDYGRGGFIGHGLTFTKSIFTKTREPFTKDKVEYYRRKIYGKIPPVKNRGNWKIMAKELRLGLPCYGIDNSSFRKLVDDIFKKGVEIAPHCLAWESLSFGQKNLAFRSLRRYKCQTWIDHGEKYCYNSLTSFGADSKSKFYVLDALKKGRYKYAWAYKDYAYKGDLNLKEIDPNFIYFNKKLNLWMFKTFVIKPAELNLHEVYSKKNVDKLIKKGGIHISHTYFLQPRFYNKKGLSWHFRGERYIWFIKDKLLDIKNNTNQEIPNGVIIKRGDVFEIDKRFDKCLEYMAKKQKEGKLQVITISAFFNQALGGRLIYERV